MSTFEFLAKKRYPSFPLCLSFPRSKVHFQHLIWAAAQWQDMSKCPINNSQSRNGAAKTSLGDFLPGEGEHLLLIIHIWMKDVEAKRTKVGFPEQKIGCPMCDATASWPRSGLTGGREEEVSHHWVSAFHCGLCRCVPDRG